MEAQRCAEDPHELAIKPVLFLPHNLQSGWVFSKPARTWEWRQWTPSEPQGQPHEILPGSWAAG